MTRKPSKVSRKDKYKEECLIRFDQLVTYVEGINLHSRQPVNDIDVSASSKELYVNKRKIKWENVLDLTIRTTLADGMGNYENGKDTGAESEPSQVEMENDGRWYREDISITLHCREDKQKKGDQDYVADSDYNGRVRIFEMVQPQLDRSNRQDFAQQWQAFRRVLQDFHGKELFKRQRRADREKEEEELYRKKLAKEKSMRKGGGGGRRSYGSKQLKGQKFLNSNFSNIRDNQQDIDDDDDDEEWLNRHIQKTQKESTADTIKRLQEEEDLNNDVFANNSNAAVGDTFHEADQESSEPSHLKQDDEEEEEEEWNEGSTVAVEDSKEEPADAAPMDVDDLADSDDETKVAAKKADKPKKVIRSRRRKKVKAVVQDNDSEDENIFGSQQTLTTPSTQIVVSPGATTAARKNKNKALVDDDSDEEEQDDDAADKTETRVEMAKSPKVDENTTKITNFFTRGGASKPTKSTAAGVTKSLKGTTKPDSSRPQKRKEPTPLAKSPDPFASSQSDEEPKISSSPKPTSSSIRARAYFQPQKKAKATTPQPETPTEPGSRSSSARKHAVDTGSDEEATMSAFRGTQRKRKSPEDEDPIEDYASSQSQGHSRSFARSKNIRRGKVTYSNKIALGALDFADSRSPHKGFKLVGSGERHPKYSIGRKKHGALSPMRSPTKKLNFDVLADDDKQEPPKWRGLGNFGNTCYMNSSLQALYSISQFMAAISPSKEGHELVRSLVEVWEQLNEKSLYSAASARPVKSVIDKLTDRFRGYEQRDAHEFLGEVIDAIHEELVKDKNGDDEVQVVEPTDEYFCLEVEVCLTCKSCGYYRAKKEMYRNLSLDIVLPPSHDPQVRRNPNVESCLTSFFQPEDREIKCEKCEEGQVATQQISILSRPKALLLHLKRFIVEEKRVEDENHPNGGTVELVYRKKKVPLDLDASASFSLDAFLSESVKAKTTSQPSTYSLKSVVHHHGNTASSGHYTADGLRGDTWVSFDDGKTKETTLKEMSERPKQKSAYMLMYSLV